MNDNPEHETLQAPVLIAGGGIGGLSPALALPQLGVPCLVFEALADLQPLGVGINLRLNAMRELFDLGLTEQALNAAPARPQ